MMSEEFAVGRGRRAGPVARCRVSLHLEVDRRRRPVRAGGRGRLTLDRGPEDTPPAGRVAVFRDPFGHRWFLNQRLG